ncbi:U-scoloptoxin(19)-Sm1a-like [Choristoneura fumiferana]|uniref:U-scoloptoxin(19)-Sm1a-like n=1 Tax=Choristoneura fumiferana TaxID=7141 RepID=UPI003D15B929
MALKALVFGAFLLMCVSASPMVKRSNFVGQITALEEPCILQGGLCVHIDDCPTGSLVQLRGVLCPNQASLGAECCYV